MTRLFGLVEQPCEIIGHGRGRDTVTSVSNEKTNYECQQNRWGHIFLNVKPFKYTAVIGVTSCMHNLICNWKNIPILV